MACEALTQRGRKHAQQRLLVQAAAILAWLTEIWCKPCLTYFLATECGKLGDGDYTLEQCHFRGSWSALKWKSSMTDRKHTIDASSLSHLFL